MTSGVPVVRYRSLAIIPLYTVIAKLFTDNIVIDKVACAERARQPSCGESRLAAKVVLRKTRGKERSERRV